MRKRTHVGSRGYRHAGRELLSKLPGMKVEHLAPPRAIRRRGSMVGEVLRDRERGDCEYLLVAHHTHRLFAEVVGMIDRNDAGPSGIKRAWLACGVHRHPLADARRFLHGGGELRYRVLEGRGKSAIHKRVA